MMMAAGASVPIVTLAEAQAFARVETGEEEALLAGLVRTASGLCEAFLGQVVIARSFTEQLCASSEWQRLRVGPVRSIDAVTIDGVAAAATSYSTDIDSSGCGWVRLINPQAGAVVENRDDDALGAGANLAIIGDEVFQFGNAVPLSDYVFRLSRLLRGRRGTEWAMGTHFAGERFALLDPAHLLMLPLNRANIGALLRVTAAGPDDGEAAPVDRLLRGDSLKPPSPVHLRASIDVDGTLRCTWVRRSRSGWEWLDGVDAPLGCATERYRVTLEGAAGSIVQEVSLPSAEFSEAELTSVGSSAELKVVQVGDFATSHPGAISITNP